MDDIFADTDNKSIHNLGEVTRGEPLINNDCFHQESVAPSIISSDFYTQDEDEGGSQYIDEVPLSATVPDLNVTVREPVSTEERPKRKPVMDLAILGSKDENNTIEVEFKLWQKQNWMTVDRLYARRSESQIIRRKADEHLHYGRYLFDAMSWSLFPAECLDAVLTGEQNFILLYPAEEFCSK
ncbi:MAG: hypothetical protein MMC23_007276 [Stictis urceolatum]|nr:hypothetical protein [Stictis urceolata]